MGHAGYATWQQGGVAQQKSSSAVGSLVKEIRHHTSSLNGPPCGEMLMHLWSYPLSSSLRYCEKGTKFEKKITLVLTLLRSVKADDFFEFLWPSHNSLTLNDHLVSCNFFVNEKKLKIITDS